MAEMVMLALHHATQTREVAFDHVGGHAVAFAVGDGVIAAAGLELHFQHVLMAGFVGKELGICHQTGAGDLTAFVFGLARQ